MELTNTFVVGVGIEQAWDVLTDVETIAPCLPGAQLQEIDGEEYRGIVKVKVGPITAQYRGAARFVERDAAARRAVIKADGRDTRGQGNASALIRAELASDGAERTRVTITTDLTVTGKVAQFGRGVMADVSAKLMNQFADNLSSTVLADGASTGASRQVAATSSAAATATAAPAPAPTTVTTTAAAPSAASGPVLTTTASVRREVLTVSGTSRPAVRKLDLPEPEPIDLLDAAGSPLLKRAAPYALVAAVVAILMRLLGRK